MIIRIVKMNFKPEEVTRFKEVFDAYKVRIRANEGCTHLELLQEVNSPTIFFTYSHWQTETDLNNYRNSPLFEEVWAKTKVLFQAKAEAWSLKSDISG